MSAPVEQTPDELIRAHLPLVRHLVNELVQRIPTHVNRDDLVSAGMVALVTSARGFDGSRGVPFGRFASIRIRGALTDELRTMDWASRAVRSRAREAESVRTILANRLGRSADRQEVAAEMGVRVDELDAIDADVHRAALLSLQSLTPDETADRLPSTIDGPEHLLVRREQLGMLRDAIDELPERLRTVVEEYFFAQRKMADIADDLGVTESRVSQMRSEALTLLRAGLRVASDDENAPSKLSRGQSAARAAYCAAVAGRSTLAERLRLTTSLGEVRQMSLVG
ncbi:MAG TPA: sigma-70 family RNA polymerase sigma factor [Jatrophihabitans sp.]|nr:sigma-70 family RNA polymerase sigma factor [Jatrophihabitans sp.]